MKIVEIVASRSVKIDQLKSEYRKLVPADWKGTDFPFNNADNPVKFQTPANLDEALTEDGKDKVFELYDIQKQVGYNLKIARGIVDLVTDPSKVTSKAGKAITVAIKIK